MEWSEFLNWQLSVGVLDVLIVYWLIYRLLLLVRGTRAEPMLLGLAIVMLVFVASRAFGFVTLNWILNNFLGSVILVIVVLFQDDLRRALLKIGLVPGLGGDTPTAVEEAISEISKAASELASRRIGALMVIRRDVGLEEYTENAVQIGGKLSHQLLVSIFLPTSPLHDGAVVIEGDKIVAAGAVLPLTFSPTVSSQYGTRHRAAIGLSERTDALMVVVSEETGKISLIREGRISRDLTDTTLFNTLNRLTIIREQRRRRKWRIREGAKKSSKDARTETTEANVDDGILLPTDADDGPKETGG